MHRRALTTGVITLLLFAGACGRTPSNDAAAPGSAGAKSRAALLQASSGQPAERRDVVYTGDLVVRVESVPRATRDARSIATDQGGFVFGQTTDQRETRLTVKVPSDHFDAAVEGMAKLGKELRRNLKAQDVTADVVDVDGRLKTAQASADRLRGLLQAAKTPADVVAVEGELSKRETDIETLQGRLRVLNDQVALATLTVRLTEKNDIEISNDLPGFLGSLRTGLVALVNVGQVLLVVLGFLIPFVPIVVFLGWVWRRYRRRHPRAPRHAPAPPYWPPQPPQQVPTPGQPAGGKSPQAAAPPASEG